MLRSLVGSEMCIRDRFSITITEDMLPAFSKKPNLVKYQLALFLGGKKLPGADSRLWFQAYLNRWKKGTPYSFGHLLKDSCYWTYCAYVEDIRVGDIFGISMWAPTGGITWDYDAYFIQVQEITLPSRTYSRYVSFETERWHLNLGNPQSYQWSYANLLDNNTLLVNNQSCGGAYCAHSATIKTYRTSFARCYESDSHRPRYNPQYNIIRVKEILPNPSSNYVPQNNEGYHEGETTITNLDNHTINAIQVIKKGVVTIITTDKTDTNTTISAKINGNRVYQTPATTDNITIIADENENTSFEIDTLAGDKKTTIELGNCDIADITYDGTNLWACDWSNQKIYKINTNGEILKEIDTSPDQPTGITYDGTNLWITTFLGKLIKMDTDGNIITTMTPSKPIGRLTYDGTNLWGTVQKSLSNWEYPIGSKIYKIDPSTGSIVETIYPSGRDIVGVAWDGSQLFLTDYATEGILYPHYDYRGWIYRFNPNTETFSRQFKIYRESSKQIKPRGLTYDGTYLWTFVKDDGNLYQLYVDYPDQIALKYKTIIIH